MDRPRASRASAGRRAHAYLCSYHHLRGNTVCPGGLVLPVDSTNEAVLAAVEGEVLHPEVVQRAIRRAIDELNAPTDTVVPRRTGLQAELTVLEQELRRLTAAVAQGGDLRRREDGVYEFSGQASLGRLLAGVICTKAGVAPTGFEPVYDPG